MKETGMMFKAPLVRAILGGQKTQTRRIVKWNELQKGLNLGFSGLRATETAAGWVLESNSRTSREWRCKPTPCPAGQPGDRIYVRETFVQGYKADPATGVLRKWDEDGNDVPMTTWYRATDGGISWSDDDGWETNVPWKPAIHMPKSMARVWLEITDVRVERLHSISEADCISEGATGGHGAIPGYAYSATPLEHFRHIWESTGARWDDNPSVWVIDFKRIERARTQKGQA